MVVDILIVIKLWFVKSLRKKWKKKKSINFYDCDIVNSWRDREKKLRFLVTIC